MSRVFTVESVFAALKLGPVEFECAACGGTHTSDASDEYAPCVHRMIGRGLGRAYADYSLDAVANAARKLAALVGYASPGAIDLAARRASEGRADAIRICQIAGFVTCSVLDIADLLELGKKVAGGETRIAIPPTAMFWMLDYCMAYQQPFAGWYMPADFVWLLVLPADESERRMSQLFVRMVTAFHARVDHGRMAVEMAAILDYYDSRYDPECRCVEMMRAYEAFENEIFALMERSDSASVSISHP